MEDDKMSREILDFIVQDLGHQIFIFEDTTDFIQRIEMLPSKPHMVFLDIHMQPYNGFEVLAALRQHPDYQDLPIIALTASVMSEEVAQLRTAGFQSCIAKPLNFDTFPALLGRLFNGESIWTIN